MMSLIDLSGFPPSYDDGQGTGNFVKKVADSAANFVCGIYRDFPAAVVSDTSPNSFGRGLMDSLCAPRGSLPDPPTPKPGQGQCQCVFYDVTYTQYTPTGSDSTTSTVLGALSFGSEPDTLVPGLTNLLIYHWADCPDGKPGNRARLLYGIQSADGQYYATIDAISRTDGQPDSCSSDGHNWSPGSPTTVPPERATSSDIVNYNDGTDITIPLAYVPVSVDFNINPKITVNVGGIKVSFDFSGAKIDLGNDNSDPDTPRDRTNSNSDDFDRIEEQLKRIKERIDSQQSDIDAIKKDSNDTPPPDDDPTIESEEDTSESESGNKNVDKLEWVCIHLTKLPNREQWGDDAPNIYYAGWLEFRVKDCLLPRQPIHFVDSIFKAPDGATGFAFTLTNGAKGKAKVYRRKA